MRRTQRSTVSRRALLSALGTGVLGAFAGGGAATQRRRASDYAVVQGDRCEPVAPVRGRLPVEEFYDYQLPKKYVSEENGASIGFATRYASAGTVELQREKTSLLLLYRGPKGLSLVVVHGRIESSIGGSVTFGLDGLPSGGEWAVRDDFYRNPNTGVVASTNFDRWRVDGSEHVVDWTWGKAGTDGGAFRGLGENFDVVVRPGFNEDAALEGEHYEGEITDWEFLSGSAGVSERVSLDLDRPIRIRTGTCE
ncbi:hypothetical protein [Halorussus marinus]|uniref:hypothetical protein n=1 Tax=Halorussus marinus TaxID=2505976 RepID=UPI00106E2642|nr:hypothetical protein [Halorussus marinus]